MTETLTETPTQHKPSTVRPNKTIMTMLKENAARSIDYLRLGQPLAETLTPASKRWLSEHNYTVRQVFENDEPITLITW